MKKFSLRMAALMLCLFTVSLSFSSCSIFTESFLSEYIDVGTKERIDKDDTTRIGSPDTEPERSAAVTEEAWQDTQSETPATRPVTTTAPETTVPETTDNIPDELQDHVYLSSMNEGRCKTLIGNVNVTVIIANDAETSWDSASRAELISSLTEQEKMLEADARSYGKELDVTFSFIDAAIDSKAVVSIFNLWEEEIIKAAGFASKSGAQKELDDQNDADSNPIMIALNKEGRAYALQQSSEKYSEIFVVYSSDMTAFRHELYHLYGAEDLYYPSEVKTLAEQQLSDSIMNSGATTDALTAFIIGWDDELDSNAYEFLKGTSHLTEEYLKAENEKEMYTGYVTDHQLSYGVYTGYLEHGMPSGYGTLIYTEGGSYEGYFVNGKYNGKGIRIWANGDKYDGNWAMNTMQGKGIYTWASGEKYDGDWVNGARTGKGTYTWASGNSYTGDFVNGIQSGKGTLKWTDGSSYTGDFVNGERTGSGKFTWPDGTYYDGSFVNGKFEGQGTYVMTDGFIYVGAFKNNDFHGYGKATYANGSVYEGYFVNGMREGNGTMRYADGSVYTGSWRSNTQHGQGTYTYAYGHKYVGAWENGSRSGYGVMTWADGSSYDGYWLNNKRHGYGKYINQYGNVFEGQWANDVFQG